MGRFLAVVLAGALFGGLCSYALLPLWAGDLQQEVGWGGVKVQVEGRVYDHDQLLAAIFSASAGGSVIAAGMAWGLSRLGGSRRRR